MTTLKFDLVLDIDITKLKTTTPIRDWQFILLDGILETLCLHNGSLIGINIDMSYPTISE